MFTSKAASLLAAFSLFLSPCVSAETVTVERQGFSLDGNPIPAPAPNIDERENRTPWPRVVPANMTQGHAIYPVRRAYLDLSLQDWNQDGKKDLLYLHKDDAEFAITVYPADGNGGFASPSDFSFSVPADATEAGPTLIDLTGDGKKDLLLIVKYPVKRFFTAVRVRYLLYPGEGNGYRPDNPVVRESDEPPSPAYLVRSRETDRAAIVVSRNTLVRPTKKALARLILNKSVLYAISLQEYREEGFTSVHDYSFKKSLDEEDYFLSDAEGWKEIELDRIYHWDERQPTFPTLYYDWNGDGTEDVIEISAGENHTVTDGKTGAVITEFRLQKNNLLTGPYADIDGDHSLKEVVIYADQRGAAEVHSEVTIRAPFQKNAPEESYDFDGLVVFPQSFADYDKDGDLDVLALNFSKSIGDILKSALRFLRKGKSHAELLIYDRSQRGFSREPSSRRKIEFSGSIGDLSSVAELL